jgi:hypothetical protein
VHANDGRNNPIDWIRARWVITAETKKGQASVFFLTGPSLPATERVLAYHHAAASLNFYGDARIWRPRSKQQLLEGRQGQSNAPIYRAATPDPAVTNRRAFVTPCRAHCAPRIQRWDQAAGQSLNMVPELNWTKPANWRKE